MNSIRSIDGCIISYHKHDNRIEIRGSKNEYCNGQQEKFERDKLRNKSKQEKNDKIMRDKMKSKM
jgi:hypothetical protein